MNAAVHARAPRPLALFSADRGGFARLSWRQRRGFEGPARGLAPHRRPRRHRRGSRPGALFPAGSKGRASGGRDDRRAGSGARRDQDGVDSLVTARVDSRAQGETHEAQRPQDHRLRRRPRNGPPLRAPPRRGRRAGRHRRRQRGGPRPTEEPRQGPGQAPRAQAQRRRRGRGRRVRAAGRTAPWAASTGSSTTRASCATGCS